MNAHATFRAAFALVLAVAMMAASPRPGLATEEEERRAVVLVIENGGTIQDPAGLAETAAHLLGQLTELARRRATRETEISIILSANPTEVSWSGTPGQLLEQAPLVLELIEVRPTCSDLVRAWQQADTVLRITAPHDVRLYGIGPGIQAGFPCDGDGGVITLPQPVSPEMSLARLAGTASVLRLFGVHPDQDEMLLDYLEGAGILARAQAGAMEFDLLDAARTRARLGDLY